MVKLVVVKVMDDLEGVSAICIVTRMDKTRVKLPFMELVTEGMLL
jgi:hypothetical protein